MSNRRPSIAPSPVPVINVTASAMPLPTALCQVILAEESKSMMRLIKEMREDKAPFVLAVMSRPNMDQVPERFCRVGVLCSAQADSDSTRVFLKGESRVAAAEPFDKKDDAPDSYFTATVKRLRDDDEDKFEDASYKQIRADLTKVKHLLQRFHKEAKDQWDFNGGIMEQLLDNFENLDFGDRDAVDKFIWWALAAMPELLQEDKQPFLESDGLFERVGMMIELLKDQLKILARHRELDGSPQKALPEGQKDSEDPENEGSWEDSDRIFEAKGVHPDIKRLWKRLKKIRDFLPEEAKALVKEDFERLLSHGGPQGSSAEWTMYKGRLDFFIGLPWNTPTGQNNDINLVARALDEDHFGLKVPKQRICDGIAPKILNPEGKGQILCFVGPPGVGKTSLAKSIARALGRKLVKMSVGGVRDEAMIRGHRVTYIGAQPGEVLKLMRRCGAKDPVFVIDEIDKIGGQSMSGDPSSALLEVLDPEQNFAFKDHYLNCGFDLSKVMFICTANVADDIQPALRDRMDKIRLPGYLPGEKLEIAKRHLISKWMEEVGLTKHDIRVTFPDEIILGLIQGYTNEAGVRGLENFIAAILRKVAREYLGSRDEGQPITEFVITEKRVNEFLGPPKAFKDKARPTKVGEAIGLAWTEIGGSILYIQSVLYPNPIGKKAFARTGMQGDVMKEADEVAMTLVRIFLEDANPSRSKEWRRKGIHLHIPDGAIPKDGPSAGVTAFASLYSLATGKVLRPFLAMTGEVELVGNVLPVGGIREKVVAAERAGIQEVILPKANERNLYDVPDEVKEKLKFHFVETLEEMIEIAFPPR